MCVNGSGGEAGGAGGDWTAKCPMKEFGLPP